MPSARPSAQAPSVPSKLKAGAFFPTSILLMLLRLAEGSILHRLEYGVQVQMIAEVHELLAQHADVQAARHVDDELHGEHGRPGVRRGIRARGELGDIDAPLREKTPATPATMPV